MKYVVAFALLLAFALALVWHAQKQSGSTAYAVELIRGTDSEQPEPGARRVGPELASTFRSVFKWKDYWQVASARAMAPRGKVTRLPLSHERGVEIDLTCPGKRSVAALWKGAIVGRSVCPVGEGLSLIGGDRDQNSAWFIVVRREEPESSPSSQRRPTSFAAQL